ncbi:HpcH/HpaI aldolase/citrate lyase family protein [Microbacterium sp. 22303]|uniref:HpcH/HpaI aldolase/citrate lyase family protein n=1 Tax=Microbacterium sp. 22303 TaxID=3453905 RepID=UPI003F8380D5
MRLDSNQSSLGSIGLVRSGVTALFVPGNHPERFRKAAGSGADIVIIDLEDAVGDADKDAARLCLTEYIASEGPSQTAARIVARVNPSHSLFHGPDIDALRAPAARELIDAVMVPKAEDPSLLENLARDLPGTPLIALIESAIGMENAVALGRATAVVRLAFGAVDFAEDVGATQGSLTVESTRARLVLASRIAGCAAPLDSPALDIRDTAAVDQEARRAHGLGYGGKMCIHPSQVDVVRRAFSPTNNEVAWARQIVEVAGPGAVQVDGYMVDPPVIARAQRILSALSADASSGI